MPQPLAGYRIADFSHVMAGPFCSHFLRLLGAEVVKIEALQGDPMRTYGPFREWDGMAPAFVAANVGKRSVAVNLKAARGAEIARRIVATCDVVLENFRPGVMHRLGLGYEACRQLRPALVYCSISGYGQSGPQRDYPAIDNIVQAASGMMAANGEEGDPPSRVGWPVVDTYTGTLAALAVLAALLQKERFHEGQYIDVGMLDASLVMLTSLATAYLVTGQMLPRTGNIGYSGSPTAAVFPTLDGTAISLGVVQDKQFAGLCRAIGRPDLLQDARFATLLERARPEHARRLREQLIAVFATRPGLEWERILNAAGAPCALIRDIAAACDAARHTERHLIEEVAVKLPTGETRTAGYLNAGFVFAQDGPGGPQDVPELGRDTREVLRSLDYAESDIDALIAQGVVGVPT
ncbi:MAG TPA: CoA transferase [Steroidobacteraceae bacterium]|nr:CoA transferase [Steroidobacteraceae bacterium]